MRLLPKIQESRSCRLAVVLPASSAVLAENTVNGYALPTVEIPQRTRYVAQIQQIACKTWALNIIVLDFLVFSGGRGPCVVAELLVAKNCPELQPIHPRKLAEGQLDEAEEVHLDAFFASRADDSPFSRLGWIDEAIQWVETASGHRLSSKADIEQLNAGGRFALLRFLMDNGSRYWLKATGSPNIHELSVTTILSRYCADYLPTLIAACPAWNAWISSEDGTPMADLPSDPERLFQSLKYPVMSMAQLQIATLGRRQKFLDAGAFDQGMGALHANCDGMFEFLSEAMKRQTSKNVAPLEPKRLEELCSILKKSCDRIDALGIPETVVHGDLNRGNILIAGEHCQFIDWSEAYVGFPFISLDHMLLLNRIENSREESLLNLRLRGCYQNAWRSVCDPVRIENALKLAPVLAIASTLYGRGDWLNSPFRETPQWQSYARTLARHMDRVARVPEFMEALCAR